MKKIFFLLVLGMYPSAGAVIKSVPAVSNVPSVYFDKTAYAVVNDQPMLFLGSATELITTNPAIIPNETNFALARLVLENNNETEQTAAVQPLAPAKVTLNGGANLDNPLLAKKVKHLGLYKNSYPIVVPETPATNAQPTSNQFFVVTDVTAGTKMLGTKDSGPIKDAANADVTTVLANVAGGNDFVFVAVPDATASSFGAAAGVNRGVAILKEVTEKQEAATVSSFQQLNALDVATTTEVSAAKIFVDAADQLIAFSQGGGSTSIQSAVIGDDVAMCWDETLQRLYVGFSNVERDDATKEGGVMDIIMGFVDTTANIGKGNSFTLSPFVYHPTKAHFYDDQNIGHDYDVAVYNVMEQMDVATAAASAMSGNALNVVNAVTPVSLGGMFPINDVDGNTLKNMDGDPVTYATLQANKFSQTYASLTAVITAANTAAAGGASASAAGVRDAVNAEVMKQIIALRSASKNAIKDERINTTAVPFGMYFDGTTKRKNDSGVWTAENDGNAEITLSAPIIKTMHTSAGRPYLIFNGATSKFFVAIGTGLFGGAREDRVYAIPLVGDIVNEEPETKGSVAKVTADGVVDYRNGRYDVPTKISEMPLKSHPAVAVGGSDSLSGADIKDIFAQGDSVFMALAGFDNDNVGIFKSTAILNAQGFIVDWTPAERVMGSVSKAYGAGLDTTTGNFYFLGTQNDADPLKQMIPNAGQITTWGLGDASLHGGTQVGLLSTQLGALFSSSTGGVHQVFNFDENTPSFYRGRFSMMVAVGSRQLALIETGSFSAGELVPTVNFADTIYVQTDPLLTAIAPLRCVAITQQFNRLSGDQTQPDRNPATGQSLMFVGGYSGVVKGTATDPANEKKGLLDVSEITWSNSNLTDIKDPVIKIVALPDQIYVDTAGTRRVRNGALYVLTNKKLYRRSLNGAANGNVAVESGNDLVVARDSNYDDVVFVATPQGLLWSVNALGGPLVELRAVVGGGNETLQLDYLSGDRNGVPQLPGNLYALMRGQRVLDPLEVAENEANDIVPPHDIVTQVYRFAVIEDSAAGTISAQIIDKRGTDATQQVVGPLVQYDEFRSNFATDGALVFNTNPKDQTSNDFVRVTSISTTTTQDSVSNDNSITAALNVDLDKNYNVGTIVRDSASGAWVVPGDWGVRVNE